MDTTKCHENTFFLEPVPPFQLDLTVWALRRRPDNAIDRWDGRTLRRIIPLSGQVVEVAVEQVGPPEAPRLSVTVLGASLDSKLTEAATLVLERLLGLRIDLRAFYDVALRDSSLGPLAREFQGLKPPRVPTVFESVVSAIACQQTKLTEGIHLLNRLAELRGLAITGEGGAHGFPRPEDLATLGAGPVRSGHACCKIWGSVTAKPTRFLNWLTRLSTGSWIWKT